MSQYILKTSNRFAICNLGTVLAYFSFLLLLKGKQKMISSSINTITRFVLENLYNCIREIYGSFIYIFILNTQNMTTNLTKNMFHFIT